jgi:hypothetical protein
MTDENRKRAYTTLRIAGLSYAYGTPNRESFIVDSLGLFYHHGHHQLAWIDPITTCLVYRARSTGNRKLQNCKIKINIPSC